MVDGKYTMDEGERQATKTRRHPHRMTSGEFNLATRQLAGPTPSVLDLRRLRTLACT